MEHIVNNCFVIINIAIYLLYNICLNLKGRNIQDVPKTTSTLLVQQANLENDGVNDRIDIMYYDQLQDFQLNQKSFKS